MMIMAEAQHARFSDPVCATPSPSSNTLAVLGSCFQSFISATNNEVGWDVSKRRIAELEEQLHAHGICGPNAIPMLMQLRSHICWEAMVPDQFIRFYRFLFHACKEPRKKHVRVDVALQVWQLVLAGRFRLLDRWCEFVQGRSTDVRVISEDQWRQVLDFSRSVHEDLSNFDLNGAWVWLLDDFVEYMKKARQTRAQSMDCEGFLTDSIEPDSLAEHRMSPAMSPRCGSKRRSPDIDVVAQQLSAMPLSSGNLDNLLKRHCGGLLVSGRALPSPPGALVAMSSSPVQSGIDVDHHHDVLLNLPAVQTTNRRTVRTRRSGVSDLVNRIVSDTLGFSP